MGTKLDLVRTGAKEREVTYEEAVQFAKRMKVAAVVETSVKDEAKGASDIDDVFYISACKCFDMAQQPIPYQIAKKNSMRSIIPPADVVRSSAPLSLSSNISNYRLSS